MKSVLLSFFPILLGFFITQCGSSSVMPSFDYAFFFSVAENDSSADVLSGVKGISETVSGSQAWHKASLGTAVAAGMMSWLNSINSVVFVVLLGIIVILLLVLTIVVVRRPRGSKRH